MNIKSLKCFPHFEPVESMHDAIVQCKLFCVAHQISRTQEFDFIYDRQTNVGHSKMLASVA